MLSNHYPLVWSSRFSPAIVALVVVAGAVIRHFFNARHAHRPTPWWTWGVAAASMALAAYLSIVGKPGDANLAEAAPAAPAIQQAALFDEAMTTVQSRCSMCHAAEPVWDGIRIAPKGVRLDTPDEIARHADAIRIQSVLTHAMPPNNLTEMTLDERRTLARWLAERDRAARGGQAEADPPPHPK
jgi:uncharacterized membrane protein